MKNFITNTLAVALVLCALPFVIVGALGWFCYRATACGPSVGEWAIEWVTA